MAHSIKVQLLCSTNEDLPRSTDLTWTWTEGDNFVTMSYEDFPPIKVTDPRRLAGGFLGAAAGISRILVDAISNTETPEGELQKLVAKAFGDPGL